MTACTAAQLGEQSHEQTTSPGTVTVRLLLPTDRTFCDLVDGCSAPTHVTFGTAPGTSLAGYASQYCSVDCATCRPTPCPAIPPCRPSVAVGVAVTNVEATWDGSYIDSSTCGSGTTCYAPHYVTPGRYYARLCVTPGTMMTDTTCTQTGPQECVDTQFDLPGPSPIVVPLVQIMGG